MVQVGPAELIVVLVIALVVLGPHRLPEAGRAVGKGLREFRHSFGTGIDDDTSLRRPLGGSPEPVRRVEERAPPVEQPPVEDRQ